MRDESGQTVVVVAVFLGILAIAFLAMALDVGYLFRERRMAQTAADAAAVAAAEEAASGNPGNEQTVANAVAKLNGFDTTLAKNPAVVTFPTPSGTFSGTSYVAVTVSKPIPTLFMGAFSSTLALETVSGTAIAGGGQLSQTCVCINGSSGQTLSVTNGATLNAEGCGVVDDSTSSNGMLVSGNGTLTATSFGLVSTSWSQASGVVGGSTLTGKVVQGVSSCAPTLPPAPSYSTCVADPGGSYGTFTFGPSSAGGTICYNALTVGASGSTCTLTPGIYVIKGTLHFQSGANCHSNLGGNGVFFYLTGSAKVTIDSGANVNLVAGGSAEQGGGTAPSLGAYNGIAIYQALGDSSALAIQGGSTSYIGGALYAPSAAVSVGNGSSMTFPVGGLLATSLTVNGGSTLNVTNFANEGAVTLGSPKLVQ